MKKRRWKFAVFLACCFAIYIGVYAYLSWAGGYELLKTGRFTQFNLPTSDIWLWEPRFGIYDPYFGKTDALGDLFYPLIALDQKCWHKDRPFFEEASDGTLNSLPPPPGELLNPRFKHNEEIVLEYWRKIKVARDNHNTAKADRLFDEMAGKIEP